jgi:hypothetical protein
VSQLLYAGKLRREVAGYSSRFIRDVLGLERDSAGQLIRRNNGLPPWVKVDSRGQRIIPQGKVVELEIALKQAWKQQGKNYDELWDAFLKQNPRFGNQTNVEHKKGPVSVAW